MESEIIKRLSLLENKIARIEDKQCIENLVSKHNFYFSAGQGRKIVPELWTSDEKASIEYGASGVYGALWKVITFYVRDVIPGCFATFSAMNQWIQVSENGNHASGVWMVIGTETDAGDFADNKPAENDQRRVLFSSESEGKAYRAEILFQKHVYSFTKEAGDWKIHDLHVEEIFRMPAGSDWVHYAKERQVTDGMWLEHMFDTPDPIPSFENLPSAPTTYHWQYDVDTIPELHQKLADIKDGSIN